LQADNYERNRTVSNVVDIESRGEPDQLGPRALRVMDLALADGASPFMALLVADAVDSPRTEKEFFEMVNPMMSESDLRGFLREEVLRQLHRLDLRPFKTEEEV
jgi:hypothetical protein